MRKSDMPKERYARVKSNLIANGTHFMEQSYGSRRKIWVGDKFVGTTVTTTLELKDLSTQQFGSFLAQFTKKMYSQFRKNEALYDLKVNFKGISRGKNNKQWKLLTPGTFYYNLDLSSAYWQIAHKLGYIDDKLFVKYMLDDKYKDAKRLCISFLARPNKMNYVNDEEITTISCDTGVLLRVYENIRNELYNQIQRVYNEVDWIEYSIDGISVPKHEVKRAEALLSDFIYKKTLCIKLDQNTYRQGSKIRTWKKVIRIKTNSHD